MKIVIITSLIVWLLIGCTTIWIVGSDAVTVTDSKELPFASKNDSATDIVVDGDNNTELEKVNKQPDQEVQNKL